MRNESIESAALKICIFAALPQEYAPLKKLVPSWQRLSGRPFRSFLIRMPGKKVLLVESGMGREAVDRAVETAVAEFDPDMIVFSGFSGGLHPGLVVGDVCIAVETFMSGSPPGESATAGGFSFRFGPEFSDFMIVHGLKPIAAVTTGRVGKKTAFGVRTGDLPEAVDMETACVAETVFRMGLPFVCFRAISDALCDDLGFDVGAISDEQGKIRIAKVLRTIVIKPRVVGSFYLAWRRSRKAAQNLCRVLAAFLGAPVGLLGRIRESTRVERV